MQLPRLADLPPSPAHEALHAWHLAHPEAGIVGVAYSGGADSSVLLIQQALECAAKGLPLWALHVDHGLQPAAADFVAHCQAFCDALDQQTPTRLVVTRVKVHLPPQASLEAQARDARYDALATSAREYGIDTVLLAQHADDQAETLLIALGRGAGMAGLAGMGAAFEHRGIRFARPLLDVAAAEMRGWLRDNAIAFVDDPSNADEHRTRNRVRRRLMPALEEALPEFRQTFARSARHAQAAQELLEERARDDLAHTDDPPRIAELRTLSAARLANLLRHWLRTRHGTIGSEAQIQALIAVLRACTTRGHRIHIKVGEGHVEREGERIAYRRFL